MADVQDERRALADRLARFYASFVEVRDAAIDSAGATAWDIFADACEANLPTILAALREPSGYRAGAEAGREQCATLAETTAAKLEQLLAAHHPGRAPVRSDPMPATLRSLAKAFRSIPDMGPASTPEAGQAEGGDQ